MTGPVHASPPRLWPHVQHLFVPDSITFLCQVMLFSFWDGKAVEVGTVRGGERGQEQAICLNCSPSSEWPLCYTRPEPPTAMDLGVQSMHPWRRGMDTRCLWETPVSGLPLCMCWETSFRASGSWLPLSSSTSRYCDGSCLSLPPCLHALFSSWYPLPPSSTSPSSFPGPLPALGCVSFPLCKILRVPSGCLQRWP